MKKLFFSGILLPLATLLIANHSVNAQTASTANSNFCNIRALADSCKGLLKPFRYSGQNAIHVALKSEPQVKEVVFPAFSGEKYRIIINTTDMPKGTEVDIYDQDARHRKRQVLYSTKTNGLSNFDTDSKSGKLYITYTIPAATATDYSGCAAIVIGFENNFGGGK